MSPNKIEENFNNIKVGSKNNRKRRKSKNQKRGLTMSKKRNFLEM